MKEGKEGERKEKKETCKNYENINLAEPVRYT